MLDREPGHDAEGKDPNHRGPDGVGRREPVVVEPVEPALADLQVRDPPLVDPGGEGRLLGRELLLFLGPGEWGRGRLGHDLVLGEDHPQVAHGRIIPPASRHTKMAARQEP